MARAVVGADDLRRKIEQLPRVQLAVRPTPLQECPRLSEALGGPRILMKRDDLTGLAFGGNKSRKLEFYMAELLRDGCEWVVTGAAKQSNFARQTAAAAAALGMKATLVLMGDPATERQGNLLLDDLLGADILLHDVGSWAELHRLIHQTADELSRQGIRARALTGFEPLGAVAYVDCVLELLDQCGARGVSPDYVFLASGTGTQAGLEVGVRSLGLDWRVVGCSPSPGLEGYDSVSVRLAEVATWLAQRLDLDITVTADRIVNVSDYVGAGYARLTPDAIEAIRLVARTEGILLDPVYTGKAMAGLIDWIRRGRVTAGQAVVFVHTGGTPALFAYHKELAES